ncbi:MAG TPA: FixH family protein [Terracidiphilus sp.]|nr:FixH family protein [Terracidiphilus sp.]
MILAAAPVLVATGCRKQGAATGDVSVDASITPQPVHTGSEVVAFRLANSAHQPVAGARVQVEGDMSHPGMAPVFADAQEISPGTYKASLNFTMGGDWVVIFHITLSDGRKVERQMDVKGVESN